MKITNLKGKGEMNLNTKINVSGNASIATILCM